MAPIQVKHRGDWKRPKLYDKQGAAIFAPQDFWGGAARYSFIEASTKTGKTYGCLVWLLELALLLKKGRGKNVWWVAPIYSQAKMAYKRMVAMMRRGFFQQNKTDMCLTIPHNGVTIWFKSADNPDGLFGEDVYGAVIDEASRAKEDAWYAVRSTLTYTRAPCRFIGNVKGRNNWFYQLARKAEAGEPGWGYYKILAYDAVQAGVLSAEEVEDAKRTLPEAVFRELYLAEPSDDGGNPFGLKAIRDCISILSTEKVECWGIDLAKSHDWTVAIGLDKNGRVVRIERFQMPWMATIERLRTLVGYTPALVDSTGVGDPVLEALQHGGKVNFEGYKFTQSSKQVLMEGLAVAIQSGKVAYPAGPIVSELELFEFEYTRIGTRYSAPPGSHDDCVCSLALAIRKLSRPVPGDAILEWYRKTNPKT